MSDLASTALRGEDARTPLLQVLHSAETIILGKRHQLRLSLTCLLAGGHLLIEDVPGIGKTTLAQTLARLLGLDYQRIQFTADLLPADVLGVSIYEPRDGKGRFAFHKGPIFSHLVLADEVNRASPKAQSALLEAMEESQVTVDGVTRALPEPFFVVATQNPDTQLGTFPLPESQLDRFLMRIHLGYPPPEAERDLLGGRARRTVLRDLMPVMNPEQIRHAQSAATEVQTSDALLDYLLRLVRHTRENHAFSSGLSPRAGLAIRRAAQAWAMLDGRAYVLPEDIQAVLPAVVTHRLRPVGDEVDFDMQKAVREIIQAVPVD